MSNTTSSLNDSFLGYIALKRSFWGKEVLHNQCINIKEKAWIKQCALQTVKSLSLLQAAIMALLEREEIKKGTIAVILHLCLGLVVVVSCAHVLDLHTPGCKSQLILYYVQLNNFLFVNYLYSLAHCLTCNSLDASFIYF